MSEAATLKSASSTPHRNSNTYQITLVLVLSFNFGVVFLHRNALGFLMPFIQPDLGLSNTEVGLLSSALSLTWAFAGIFVGRFSDRNNIRKPLLLITTIGFCLCTILTGVATSLLMLLLARILMGMAQGGVMPVSHAMVASGVEPQRHGLAMGVTQMLGSEFIGSVLGPIILVPIAVAAGWRYGLFAAAIPAVIGLVLVWALLKNPEVQEASEDANEMPSTLGIWRNRNMIICTFMSVLLLSNFLVTLTFMPLYLTQSRGFEPELMALLMAVLGITSVVGCFVLPPLSDAIGRKPVFFMSCLLAGALPVAALYAPGQIWVLVPLFGIGWIVNGIFPLFMATVPAESIDLRLTGTLTGLVMGVGEVLGGVAAPLLAGGAADIWGLRAIMWLMLACVLASAVLSLALKESAPRIVAKRQKQNMA